MRQPSARANAFHPASAGSGDPSRAHERVYVTTMEDAGLTEDEVNQIVVSAEEMWTLWIAFFDRLRQVMFEAAPAEAAEAVAV